MEQALSKWVRKELPGGSKTGDRRWAGPSPIQAVGFEDEGLGSRGLSLPSPRSCPTAIVVSPL